MKRRKRASKTPVNFVLQIEVAEKSPYWSVLKYYQQLEKEQVRQRLVEAAAAFWQPWVNEQKAKKDNGEWDRREVKKSVYQLQQQILYLQSQFGERGAGGEEGRLQPLAYQRREPLSFDFRYQVWAEEVGKLAEYLMDLQEQLTPQQKILWSSLAYWGAIADRELGLLDEAGLNQSAANCIIRLRQHIEYLEDYFQVKEVPTAPVMALPAGWGVATPSNGSSEVVAKASEGEGGKEASQTELNPEIQRLLRGNPESDKFMTEMFASL